jgi:uncharacterized protein (DUF2147 family)
MKLNLLRDGVLVLALALITGLGTRPGLADPKGMWRASDGGTTRITACGDALCGYIVTIAPRNDPETGRPWTDKHNPDPGRRSRPLTGAMVLISLRQSAPGAWTGKLYNHDDGGTYEGHVIEQGPNNIRVEGCALGVCGGEDLVRVR